MTRGRGAAMGAVLVALLFAASSSHAQPRSPGNEADAVALRTSQAAIGKPTADHTFVDQDGRPLTLAELRGRPLVVSLVFTNCYAVCSGLTLHLRDVVATARRALGTRSFGVLTVGFDTEHDTPARMRAYGSDRGIADPDWHFASADPATIAAFADELGFTWAPSPRGFDHIAQVTLLDGRGVVEQQVYGEGFAPPELIEPLRQMLLDRPLDRPSVQGLIERVRLYCSVYDPATGRYRIDPSMLAAGIPVLFVLGMVAFGVVLSARRKR